MVGLMASCNEPVLKSDTTPTISGVHSPIPNQNLFPSAACDDSNPSSCINFSLTTHLAIRCPSGNDFETALVSLKLKILPAFSCISYSEQNLSSLIIRVTCFRFGSSRPTTLIIVPQCVFTSPLGGLVE